MARAMMLTPTCIPKMMIVRDGLLGGYVEWIDRYEAAILTIAVPSS